MTSDNPYRPPVATPPDVIDAAPEPELSPRPISVWLMIVALALLSLAALFGETMLVSDVTRGAPRASTHAMLVTLLVIQAVKLLVGVTLMIGLWRRRRWARWLGLLCCAGLVVFSVMRRDQSVHASDAERAGGDLAQYVLLPALCVWWGWALAFSAKGRRYFGLLPAEAR